MSKNFVSYQDANALMTKIAQKISGGGGGMSALLLITSDAGSTVTVTTPSGRVITAEQVPGSSTQWQAETTEYGVYAVDSVLFGVDEQVTVSVDVCKIYLIDDMHFSATITVNYPNGATCRCQGGSESYYATGSPYIFSVHSANTFTITVTDSVGTYTDTVVITTDGQSESLTVPSPSNATANVLNYWLWFGGIDNSGGTYSTLADVLADSNALSTLMASYDAVDYLVRCTDWVTTVIASPNAMSYIGLNNYCANTLLSDTTWHTFICNSIYFENVLNAKAPAMTSNTTPSGRCFGSSNFDGSDFYQAFNQNTGNGWTSARDVGGNNFVGYDFGRVVDIYKFASYMTCDNPRMTATFYVRYSSDGANYTNAGTFTFENSAKSVTQNLNKITGRYFIIWTDKKLVESGAYSCWIKTLQFYGRTSV